MPDGMGYKILLSASSDYPSGGGIYISTLSEFTPGELSRFIEIAKQPEGAGALLATFKSLFEKISATSLIII